MDLDAARRATRHAAIAAFVSAGLSATVVAGALLLGISEGPLAAFNDPWNLLDVLLVLACGAGLLRQSRAAALTLLVYFVVAKMLVALEGGRLEGSLFALVFVYFFAQGVRGAFAAHRLRRASDPAYRRPSRAWLLLGVPVAAAALALVAVGAAIELGLLPSNEMLEGEALRPHQRELLERNGILEPGEQMRMFYSAALSSLLEDGNLLTDRRVVSWETVDGELHLQSAPYAAVGSVVVVARGDAANDTLAEVRTVDGESFRLRLTTAEGGDTRFLASLRQRVRLATLPGEVP